jgi:hypothetical protein
MHTKETLDISWKVAVFLATVLGIASGWVAMIPHVSASQSQSLNPIDPFATPFVLSNDGPLPLENVTFSCVVYTIKTADGSGISGEGKATGGFATPNMYSDEIDPGEKASLICPLSIAFKFQSPITVGDIVVIARFRIGYTPIRTLRRARFVTARSSDGNLYWQPQPVPVKAK